MVGHLSSCCNSSFFVLVCYRITQKALNVVLRNFGKECALMSGTAYIM